MLLLGASYHLWEAFGNENLEHDFNNIINDYTKCNCLAQGSITFYSLLLQSVTLICILTTNYEYDANISSLSRLNVTIQWRAGYYFSGEASELSTNMRPYNVTLDKRGPKERAEHAGARCS
jgi:hypothetical protein